MLASGRLDGAEAVISLAVLDADNDGRLDLLAAGFDGVTLLHQQINGRFKAESLKGAPAMASRAIAADLDSDGDLDVVVAGREGLAWLENQGGNGQRWLEVCCAGSRKATARTTSSVWARRSR